MKKNTREVQIEAVKAIVSGELLLEEAMEKYNVKDKRTILNWMKAISPLIQPSARSLEPITEEAEPAPYVHEYIVQENHLLKKVIGLQDQLRELEEKNAQIQAHRNLLMDKVTRLELKLQVRDAYEATTDA